ncbi:MAG TPA: flagellar biosynthesis protein FliQ [Oscillatoriaceae cyanobacterium]
MTESVVITLAQRSLWLLLELSMPTLILSLVVGLLVSIFQAVTQINEMTLTFIPKLVTVFVALIFFGPWMINITMDFVQQIFLHLPDYAH